MLYDSKAQKLTSVGNRFCKEMNIKPETIIPRGKESFIEECNDNEIGLLHYKHFVNRRQKCLLRITQRMTDVANETLAI